MHVQVVRVVRPLGHRRHRLRVRVDCSFTPMLAHHQPPPELLRFLAVYGCAGGDLLIAARAGGQLSACSFAPSVQPSAAELRTYWPEPDAFAPFRSWPAAAEPCRSCHYLSLCRGGCRVVSAHVSGDARAPDPECPRVLDYRAALADRDQVNNGLAKSAPPAVPGSPAAVSSTALAEGEPDPMTQRAKRHLKVLG